MTSPPPPDRAGSVWLGRVSHKGPARAGGSVPPAALQELGPERWRTSSYVTAPFSRIAAHNEAHISLSPSAIALDIPCFPHSRGSLFCAFPCLKRPPGRCGTYGLFQVCHLNEARGDCLQVLPLQPDSLLFAALTYFALFPASNGPLFAENWLFFQVFVKFRFLGRGGNQDCSLVPLLACFPAFRLYCFARFRASNCPRWSRRPGCCFKFRVRGRGDSVPLSAWFKLRT